MRVPLIVLVALVAAPLAVANAQGTVGNSTAAVNRCKNTPQAGQNGNSQAGAAAVAVAQADKCPAPVPPPAESPPTGSNAAEGVVYEDIDGSGWRDPYAGEMGLAGWTVQLVWNSQVIATSTTAWDGTFQFAGLGFATYSVCVAAQGGYTQTEPVSGTGCGGSGYSFSLSGTFPTTRINNNFGMMLQ